MNPLFDKLIEASKRIQGLPIMQNHREALQEIQTTIENYAKQPQTILICGECKRGKSTYINAWLGEEICPVDINICTAVVTIVKYGEKRRAIRYFGNIEQVKQENGLQKEEINFDQLENNISARMLPPDTWIVEIELPNDKLKEGVILIDTPGVGGLTATHGFLTSAYINRADMVLFATDTQSPITKTELDFYKDTILPHKITTSFLLNKCDLKSDEEVEICLADLKQKVTSVSAEGMLVNVYPVSVFEDKGLDVIEKTIPRHDLQRARMFKQQLMQELESELQTQLLIKDQDPSKNSEEQNRLNALLNDCARQIQDWSNPMSEKRIAIQRVWESERTRTMTELSNDFTALIGTKLVDYAREAAQNHTNENEWIIRKLQEELDGISNRLLENISSAVNAITQTRELQGVFDFQAQGINPTLQHNFTKRDNVSFSQKLAPVMQGAGVATMVSYWVAPWIGIPLGIIALIGGAAGTITSGVMNQLRQELTPELQAISQQMSNSAQMTFNDMNQEIYLTVNSILAGLKKQAETTKQTLITMHNDANKQQQLKQQAQAAILTLKSQIQLVKVIA